MTSILEEFAYGNICPNDQYFRKNIGFGRAMELVSCNEQMLLDRLGADDKDLFEKYVEAQGEINRLTAVTNLIYGYKLGLILTAEAFVGMGDLIAGEGNSTMPDHITEAIGRMNLRQFRASSCMARKITGRTCSPNTTR